MEKENELLRAALNRMNRQVGDEILIDSSGEESLTDELVVGSPKANTRNYQLDGMFASNYYFKTDVR